MNTAHGHYNIIYFYISLKPSIFTFIAYLQFSSSFLFILIIFIILYISPNYIIIMILLQSSHVSGVVFGLKGGKTEVALLFLS